MAIRGSCWGAWPEMVRGETGVYNWRIGLFFIAIIQKHTLNTGIYLGEKPGTARHDEAKVGDVLHQHH